MGINEYEWRLLANAIDFGYDSEDIVWRKFGCILLNL